MTTERDLITALSAKWSMATVEAPGFDEDRSRDRWVESFSRRASAPAPARSRVQQGWVFAAAAALLLVAVSGTWWWRQSVPEFGVAPGAWLETRLEQRLPMRFAEGSEVVVHGNSRVHVESVDPRGASMVVERGRVSARINHRRDTRWAFVAGPFKVRVTGTELAVDWDPDTQQFSVSVKSGSVVVSGPLLESGRTVRAGERCSVGVGSQRLEISRADAGAGLLDGSTPESTAVDVESLPVEQPEGGADADGVSVDPAVGASQQSLSWRKLEHEGRYREAFDAAKRQGFEAILVSGSASDLMSLSRAARFSGRDSLAKRCLLRVRKIAPGTGDAATAAFLLGRAAAPSSAANWFSTYLQEQPSGLLAREASGRLIESLHRAGRFAEARGAARRYLTSYPAGPHAAFARSVLGNGE